MELHYLRFFPLVIWALGFLFLVMLEQHWIKKDGREENSKDSEKNAAAIWVWGCFLFFMIGLIT